MYCRLRSAAAVDRHFKINESSIKTIVKKEKEICEAADSKTLYLLWNTFLLPTENTALMWVQDCYKKGIPRDSSIIREKDKSLYGKLKQK